MTDAMQKHLNTLLAELGDTVPAITADLARREIRGVPRVPDACPIARYLKSRDVRVTFVSGLGIEVGGQRYDMPGAPGDFVCEFDEVPDAFPEVLEARPWA